MFLGDHTAEFNGGQQEQLIGTIGMQLSAALESVGADKRELKGLAFDLLRAWSKARSIQLLPPSREIDPAVSTCLDTIPSTRRRWGESGCLRP
jgi:hypothetical protein